MLLQQANAARVGGEYRRAEQLFADAARRIDQASLSKTSEAAHLYSLAASLRLEQFRPREADALLAEAETIARGRGDRRLLARVLHKRGVAADDLGDPEAAIRLLAEAKRTCCALGDRAGDVLSLNQVALVLAGAGEPGRALTYYLRAEAAAYAYLGRRALRGYQWARGVIAMRSAMPELALTIFDRVLAGAAADGDVVAGAAVLLDLAEARAALGDYRGVEDVAVRVADLFRALDVPTGPMAAVELLRQAARCRLAVLVECVGAVRSARR